ncbi:hypothetical protein JXA56_05410 [Candidatus Micrarchaeota archaeon]|nr:hypothetical protein [Candidatus Micrarchaeota archaeon]
MAKNKEKHYGEYAFLAGIGIAVILALLSSYIPDDAIPILVAVLAILGLVVGFTNIQKDESPAFLIAAIALILAATAWTPIIALFNPLEEIGDLIVGILAVFITSLVAFVAPAAFAVAIKRIYQLARAP